MLHAERLTKLLVDEAICEVLWEQSQRDPARRELLERYLDRCELRCEALHKEITTQGAVMLARIHASAKSSDEGEAAQ
jgi:hypothetical protein